MYLRPYLTYWVQADSVVLLYLASHGAVGTAGEYCFAVQDTSKFAGIALHDTGGWHDGGTSQLYFE